MSQLRYRTRIDLGVAVVTLLTGSFFLYQAMGIEPGYGGSNGPIMLPMFIAVTMMVLGVLVALSALMNNAGLPSLKDEAVELADASGDQFGFRDSNLRRIAAVIGTGIAYLVLFHALGYFLATLMSFVLILLTFGCRNLITLAVTSVIGTIIYQYVFMHLMGLYDPPGALLNFGKLISSLSGA
ncbi:MAG: tripartite tricarboxylate transporter TctB family protein [Rhodospirillales bacterium]